MVKLYKASSLIKERYYKVNEVYQRLACPDTLGERFPSQKLPSLKYRSLFRMFLRRQNKPSPKTLGFAYSITTLRARGSKMDKINMIKHISISPNFGRWSVSLIELANVTNKRA